MDEILDMALRLASPAELREMVQALTRERDIANLALRDLAEGVDLHQCLVARPHEGILACRIESPNRGCHACRIAGTIATLIRERDEARAEVEELRTRTAAQLEIETRARDEARADAARLRRALERAERRLTELADVDTFDAEVPWPENEKPEERARAGTEDARAALAREGEAKHCAWTYDETHFAWDSSCGEKWILMDGGLIENEIRFCHGCGKLVEIACKATPEQARPA